MACFSLLFACFCSTVEATADSSKVVPLEAAHVPKEGGTVQRTKSKAGSLWGKLRQNTVKETPKIINFAETVRALAAKKYEEELDSLCNLFKHMEYDIEPLAWVKPLEVGANVYMACKS